MRPRSAFTTVELIVVTLLFTLVLGGIIELYRRTSRAEIVIGGKLASAHACQFASVEVSRRLRQAHEIFAPPVGLAEARPYLIFADQLQQLTMVHINERSDLVLWNRNTGERDVLATNVIRFRAHRMGEKLVTLHFRARDPRTGETFSLLTGVSPRNTVH